MLNLNNHYTYLRKELLFRFFIFLFEGVKNSEINRIPYQIIPADQSSKRCCIYKDREMIKYRLLALMGYNLNHEIDDSYTLEEFYQSSNKSKAAELPPLTVIQAACSGCRKSQYRVSEFCKGCLARPCQTSCPKNSIVMKNGKAEIEPDNCINCGKCKKSCPYGAIVYTPVPCEDVCPVGAIDQQKGSCIEINNNKCISCGKCARSCPFGAIVEKSHVLPIVNHLKKSEDLALLLAPSIVRQLPGTINQIKSALMYLGFSQVYELAESAQIVAERESSELLEKKENGQPFMTTSCCPAYVEAVNKHIPALKPFISHTDSPMILGAEIIKNENKNVKTVFVGPCLAKKIEAYNTDLVDFVMTFEELGTLLVARNIEILDFPEIESDEDYTIGMGFAKAGGVIRAVEYFIENPIRSMSIDGISTKSINFMKSFEKRPPKEDLIEVMACEGGCEKGPCTLR